VGPQTLLGQEAIVLYNDMITGEDRTEDVITRPEKFNIMKLHYMADHYEAEVYELDEEDFEDDEYFDTADPIHVC
jgi:hypothetical protein